MLQILENEQQTWSNLVAYVQEHNVDCDLWVGDTLDVPITPDAAKTAKTKFDRFKATGAKVDHIKVIQSPAEAAKVCEILSRLCTLADVCRSLVSKRLKRVMLGLHQPCIPGNSQHISCEML